MNYNEYQEATKMTDIRPQTGTVNIRLVCSVLGLIEELEELEHTYFDFSIEKDGILSEEDVLSEVGDCLYYIASIGIELGISMGDFFIRELPENSKYVSPAKLLKKTIRDYNGDMPHMYREQLSDYLALLCQSILPAYANIEEAMEYNIHKLLDRKARNMIQGDGVHR